MNNHFFLLFLLTGFIWKPRLLPGIYVPVGFIIAGGTGIMGFGGGVI